MGARQLELDHDRGTAAIPGSTNETSLGCDEEFMKGRGNFVAKRQIVRDVGYISRYMPAA